MLEKQWLSTALNARTLGLGTETIVFAHGFGTDQSVWDKITPFLAEHYKVVLFDWPFSGAVDPTLYDPFKYSSMEAFADVLVTLMDQMDLKAITFVGHSMSGMIGCIASIARPDLFKRLILLCASPRSYSSSSSSSLTLSFSLVSLFCVPQTHDRPKTFQCLLLLYYDVLSRLRNNLTFCHLI